jgi:hypothetical protein
MTTTSVPVEPPLAWKHHWQDPDGETCLSLAQAGPDFILRAPELADFRISSDCARIEIQPAPGASDESIRQLLVNQVLPRVVAQRGRPVLHASAVGKDESTIAFLGESGAGKSTLATWFYRHGYQLLADDCLALAAETGGTRMIPSHGGVRLWDDSPALGEFDTAALSPVAADSGKLRLDTDHDQPLQHPYLTAVLALSPCDAASEEACVITPLAGAEAVMSLLEHSFKLDITDTSSGAEQFKMLGALVDGGLPVYRLPYPHTPGALAIILERVGALAAPGN